MRTLPLAIVAWGIAVLGAWMAEPAGAQLPAPTETPELELDTRGFTGPVGGMAFSSDARWLAAAGNKEVRVWDLTDGRLHATLRGQSGKSLVGNCSDPAFSPDGKYLVVGVADMTGRGSIRVYDTSDYSEIKELLVGHAGVCSGVAFSHDGQYLATAGMFINIQSQKLGMDLCGWDWPNRRLMSRGERACSGTFSYFGFPATDPVLFLMDSEPGAWQAPEWKPVDASGDAANVLRGIKTLLAGENVTLPYEDAAPGMIEFCTAQNMFVMSGIGRDDRGDHYWAGVWTFADGNPITVYRKNRYTICALALSSDGSLAATGDELGDVHVWQTQTGRQLYHFRTQGAAVYNVAFDRAGKLLAFGTKPYGRGEWNYNHYAALDRAFDLRRRVLLDYAGQDHRPNATSLGSAGLRLVSDSSGSYVLKYDNGGTNVSSLVADGAFCYGFLRNAQPGFADPVILGTSTASLTAYDPEPDADGNLQVRRQYIGHTGKVTAFHESPDGRFLASACTDGVLRIFSLEHFGETGAFDFTFNFDTAEILDVPADGPSEKNGIEAGDVIVAIQGQPYQEFLQDVMSDPIKQDQFRVGQTVRLTLDRRGRGLEAETTMLSKVSDWARPLLSLFVSTDGEWIIWNPQGFYDCSPGADRFIGWRLSRGWDKAAKHYDVAQFRKIFYRPDVIDQILDSGRAGMDMTFVQDMIREKPETSAPPPSAPLPIAPQDAESPPQVTTMLDAAVLSQIEPPKVRILSPDDGFRTGEGTALVRVSVVPQNDLDVKEISVLVNGRPPASKDIARERSQSAGEGKEIIVEERVSLVEGPNVISAFARNSVSSSSPETVLVQYLPPRPQELKPDLYLVAVGISDYDNGDYNLRFAHRDAEEFVATWKRQEGQFFRKVESRLLTNAKANCQGIRDAMDWLLQSVTQHDVAILFFSAHGVYDTRQNYYLASHEADIRRLRSTAIPYTDINLALKDMPCRVLLFADTCHGGSIRGATQGAKDMSNFDPWRELATPEVGTILFASSQPRELSLEDPQWGHGAFTKAFLDIMAEPKSDIDGNGYLSVTEIDHLLSRRVKEITGGRQNPTTEKPSTIPDFHLAKAGLGE